MWHTYWYWLFSALFVPRCRRYFGACPPTWRTEGSMGRTVVAVQEAIGAVNAWEGDTSAIDRARRVSGMHL